MSKKGANFSLHSGSWKASAWWGVANRGRGDQGRSVDWNLGISAAGMTFLASDGWSSFQNIIFLAVFHFRWFGGVVSVHLLWSPVTHTALGLGIWREKTWGWSAAGWGLQDGVGGACRMARVWCTSPFQQRWALVARCLHMCSPLPLPTSSYLWKDWEGSWIPLIWLSKDWFIPTDILVIIFYIVCDYSIHSVHSIYKIFPC